VIVVASHPAGEDAMGAKGLPIRTDVPAAELRRLARRERNRAAAARMQAGAGALGGLSRGEAARAGGGWRGRARRERTRAAAARMRAVAGALEGLSRAEAARLAGMERQALRDAVRRFNTEGLGGPRGRPQPRRPA